ncbi:hypothetical protein BAURA86_04145, partial [Brevibacterium aurantiacum]
MLPVKKRHDNPEEVHGVAYAYDERGLKDTLLAEFVDCEAAKTV